MSGSQPLTPKCWLTQTRVAAQRLSTLSRLNTRSWLRGLSSTNFRWQLFHLCGKTNSCATASNVRYFSREEVNVRPAWAWPKRVTKPHVVWQLDPSRWGRHTPNSGQSTWRWWHMVCLYNMPGGKLRSCINLTHSTRKSSSSSSSSSSCSSSSSRRSSSSSSSAVVVVAASSIRDGSGRDLNQ